MLFKRREEVPVNPANRYNILVDKGTDVQSIHAGLTEIFKRHAKGKILPVNGTGGNCLVVTGMDEATAKDVRRLPGVRAIAPYQGSKPA
jgi:hypothetical protein